MNPTVCPFTPKDRGPGTCHACGGPLTGRQSRWCSKACSSRWWVNHGWTDARWEALRRSTGFTAEQLADAGVALYSYPFCDQCGVQTSSPEVNHVEPRVGKGYGNGCHNHQTNLQVLCHGCHVAETTTQRRERPILSALEQGVITPDTAQQYLDEQRRSYGPPRRRRRSLDEVAPSLWAVA